METPKQRMNPVQSYEYRHRMTSLTPSWCLYWCLCTNFSHSEKKVNKILLVCYYYIKTAAAAIHMSRYSEYSTEC